MLRTPRASVCLEFKTILNVLIACLSSTSDQAESASLASSIEHVHNFTVILPHRMQGMIHSPYIRYTPHERRAFLGFVGGPVWAVLTRGDLPGASTPVPFPSACPRSKRTSEKQPIRCNRDAMELA